MKPDVPVWVCVWVQLPLLSKNLQLLFCFLSSCTLLSCPTVVKKSVVSWSCVCVDMVLPGLLSLTSPLLSLGSNCKVQGGVASPASPLLF